MFTTKSYNYLPPLLPQSTCEDNPLKIEAGEGKVLDKTAAPWQKLSPTEYLPHFGYMVNISHHRSLIEPLDR